MAFAERRRNHVTLNTSAAQIGVERGLEEKDLTRAGSSRPGVLPISSTLAVRDIGQVSFPQCLGQIIYNMWI